MSVAQTWKTLRIFVNRRLSARRGRINPWRDWATSAVVLAIGIGVGVSCLPGHPTQGPSAATLIDPQPNGGGIAPAVFALRDSGAAVRFANAEARPNGQILVGFYNALDPLLATATEPVLLPADARLLWLLASPGERQSIRDRAAALVVALSSGGRDIVTSPEFADHYRDRFLEVFQVAARSAWVVTQESGAWRALLRGLEPAMRDLGDRDIRPVVERHFRVVPGRMLRANAFAMLDPFTDRPWNMTPVEDALRSALLELRDREVPERMVAHLMGKPALIAVHHASELLPLADRVLVMDPIRATLTEVAPRIEALEAGLTIATRADPTGERPRARGRWRLGDSSAPRNTRLYWFTHYVLGYMWLLCASPIMLMYIAAGACITGFVTIWFGFNYYSYGGLLKSLLHDETLVGLGTVQARVALPLITTILFVARNSAVIAADVGNRALTAQFQAMDNLGIPGRLYVFSGIIISMGVGSVVLIVLAMLLGAWASQETWMVQFPNQYRELFRSLFFRNVITPSGWPSSAMGWVVAKAAISGLLASITSIIIALGPKSSSLAVSRSVANAIVVGVIVALLVHAVISALTAI